MGFGQMTKPFQAKLLNFNQHIKADPYTDKERLEWKKINTAPRDGTPVDLWHKKGFRVTEVWWIEEDKCWWYMRSDSEFSHWSHILPPPGMDDMDKG